ncbi:hypothetical protein Tco_0168453 [Tanacetum coccineum]
MVTANDCSVETCKTKYHLPEVDDTSRPKAVNHDTEGDKGQIAPLIKEAPKTFQPPVVSNSSRNQNPEPNVAPDFYSPVPKHQIPFPSRRNYDRKNEKANDQIEKFYKSLEIKIRDYFNRCLMLNAKFAST